MSQNFPSDLVRDAILLELPDVFRQLRLIGLTGMFETGLVVSVTELKLCFSRADVFHGGGLSRSCYRRAVDNTAGKTLAAKRAVLRFTAVALPGRAAGCAAGRVAHTGVVALDDLAHVLHAAVTNFYSVPIKYLVQFTALWKVLVKEEEELAADVGCDVPAIWWVEPGRFAVASAP